MGTPAQGASGYYVWSAEDRSFEVHLSLEVIDNLGIEIMRGFGAVPKRGAEVGGILLGTIERGSETVVRVEDFQAIPCGYTRGPSFLLAPEERENFEQAAEALRPESGEATYAVGFFRSHTREGLALAPEDVELMDKCFPGPSSVALVVKPFATKASVAGFFFRQDGVFQETTPLEFPFRRRELTGEEPPEHRPLADRRRSRRGRALLAAAQDDLASEALSHEAAAYEAPGNGAHAERADPGYAYATTLPKRTKLGGWMWFPLSFIFLLLGVALGYWAALGMTPRFGAGSPPDYSLALAAQKSGENLTVEWNGEAPVIRNADRGVLEVHDGGYAKTVDLDAGQLRGGKLAFANASNSVNFRLTVYMNSRVSISETLDWRQ